MTEHSDQHLGTHEIAAYVDGTASGEGRAVIEAHLATCSDCRAEVLDVARIVRTAPVSRGGPSRIWIPAMAAAALALLWVGPRVWREQVPPQHREEAVTMTVAPRPIAPLGTVERASALLWSSVPDANSYRVRLFDADGTVLWEREATDTVVPIPDSIALRPQLLYYWRVEAHTGFDRRAESDLVEFRLQPRGP
jgi:anti-sigma factor RsiW